MRRSRQLRDDDTAIDITPMLDIVFIMLIFFVVTASFVKESGIEVDRPEAETAETRARVTMLIAIDADNRIWINRRRVDSAAVRPLVERLHAENPKGGAVIQADAAAQTGVLVDVMDQLRLAGVENVAIAAAPAEE